MPISRDPRMDRRRRVLRDSSDYDASEGNNTRTKTERDRRTADDNDDPQQRRGAVYSQDVRRACGQRLVQLIPVRRRSFAGVILLSLLVPAVLLTAHYMIFVSGSLQWWGHPLAESLYASHPSSIAAWFSSHLWLLCLGATILTFQLRRHKLDDYNGEYRLWFWLVVTCLIASIDATTHASELFGLALDRWSQINLGWSGPAVVDATLAVLIGMLGLRLCTELKSVPMSLVFWLVGLVAWAGSAALGQEEFKLEFSSQFRVWLKTTLWLGGLTAIWLSVLTYLRSVYIDAQQRFLLRGRLAARSNVPLRKRFLDALPSMPSFRRGIEQGDSAVAPPRRKRTTPVASHAKQPADTSQGNVQQARNQPRKAESQPTETAKKSSGRMSWFRKPKDRDDPDEYRKVPQRDAQPQSPSKSVQSTTKQNTDTFEQRPRRSWIPKFSRPRMPKIPKPKLGGFFSKFKLPSLRLQPPGAANNAVANNATDSDQMRNVKSTRPLPGTSPSDTDPSGNNSDNQPARPLSKAERKRLRRLQQKNRAA